MFIKLCNSGYVNINKVNYFDIDKENLKDSPKGTVAGVDIYFENGSKAGYWLSQEDYVNFIQQLEQYRIEVPTGSWRTRANEIL